jgi:hypothetical protein
LPFPVRGGEESLIDPSEKNAGKAAVSVARFVGIGLGGSYAGSSCLFGGAYLEDEAADLVR